MSEVYVYNTFILSMKTSFPSYLRVENKSVRQNDVLISYVLLFYSFICTF